MRKCLILFLLWGFFGNAQYNLFARQNFAKKIVANNFVSTWDTTKTSGGSSTSTQVKLPLVSTGTYNFIVNWGDGNSDTITVWNAAAVTHTYASSGIYTITITGTVYGWRFNDTGDKLKISSIASWGNIRLQNDAAFFGCANLNLSTVSDVPLITATSFNAMFYGCAKITSINRINEWNTSSVTDMGNMFLGCTLFNQNLSFNTSSVTLMNSMFQSCTSFNGDLSFNTSSVTNMFLMLFGCTVFNKDISAWNTGNVTNMGRIFNNCTAFNQNIGGWDTHSATSMLRLFDGATAFNQNIGSWNVSNVTNFTDFMLTKTAATFSTANLDAIYNGWSSRSAQPSITITFGTAKYTSASSAGRAILTGAPNNWVITDGGI